MNQNIKNIVQLKDWLEVEKYFLKKTSKMLSILDVNTNGCNSEVGEEVKARKLSAKIIKEVLAELRNSVYKSEVKEQTDFR